MVPFVLITDWILVFWLDGAHVENNQNDDTLELKQSEISFEFIFEF